MVVVHDIRTGEILDVNDETTRATGFTLEDLQEMGVEGFSPKSEAFAPDKALGHMNRAAQGEPQLFEWGYIDKEGMFHHTEVHLKRVTIGGEPRLLGTVRDISKRKRMEEELTKIQRLESLGVLAGGIAHDFNNLLTPILANVSIIKMYEEFDDEIAEMLTDVEKASLRAKGLIQQMLTFAKGGEPIKEAVQVSRLLKDTANFALSGSNVGCKYYIPRDLWPVEADEGQISQAIHNMVLNADQAMAEGGTIKVRAENIVLEENEHASLKDGNYVRISIEDQGSGIPEEHLSNIFDPFFTTKEAGRGLGLATSLSIVNRHEGHLYVDSTIGAGSSFTLYLPASEGAVVIKKKTKVNALKGEGRILLIDDEAVVRKSVEGMLKRLGYEVKAVSDGTEGVECYKEALEAGQPFRAVIMDLTIPGGMGGKEAIKKIKGIDPGATVVVSSGYSNDPVMANFREHGFSGVVTKPYTFEDLAEAVHAVLTGGDG